MSKLHLLTTLDDLAEGYDRAASEIEMNARRDGTLADVEDALRHLRVQANEARQTAIKIRSEVPG